MHLQGAYSSWMIDWPSPCAQSKLMSPALGRCRGHSRTRNMRLDWTEQCFMSPPTQ